MHSISIVPGLILLLLLLAIAGVIALVGFFVARSMGSQQPPGPNLQPCPDCGKPVSVRAITCPHCGGPVKGG